MQRATLHTKQIAVTNVIFQACNLCSYLKVQRDCPFKDEEVDEFLKWHTAWKIIMHLMTGNIISEVDAFMYFVLCKAEKTHALWGISWYHRMYDITAEVIIAEFNCTSYFQLHQCYIGSSARNVCIWCVVVVTGFGYIPVSKRFLVMILCPTNNWFNESTSVTYLQAVMFNQY